MVLSAEERVQLTHEQSNLAANKILLAKAQQAGNTAEVTKLTGWIKAEQATVDALLAKDAQPAPPPPVVQPPPPAPAPAPTAADLAKSAAFQRAMVRLSEALVLTSQSEALGAQAAALKAQATSKLSEVVGELGASGMTASDLAAIRNVIGSWAADAGLAAPPLG